MSNPTVLQVYQKCGLKAAINYYCERKCVSAFAKAHKDAKKNGFNLIRPDYRFPFWFKIASKIEWWTR